MWEQTFIFTKRNKSSERLQVADTFVTSNGNGLLRHTISNLKITDREYTNQATFLEKFIKENTNFSLTQHLLMLLQRHVSTLMSHHQAIF